MEKYMLQVENLSYHIKQKTILQNVSLKVQKGEFVGILGPNGSGKSTLLKNIYKLLIPAEGQICLEEKNLLQMSSRKMAQYIAVVAQENEANFDFTVREVVQMGRYPRKGLLETANRQDAEIVQRSLQQVGLDSLIDRSFLSLSGGEKQRILIARALAQETEMIILDEPTNHLDIASREWVEAAIEEFEGVLLFVSHDRYFIEKFAERIWLLENGTIRDFPCGYQKYRSILEHEAMAKQPVTAEPKPKKEKPKGGTKDSEKQIRRLEREIDRQENQISALDEKIAEASSDYMELTRLLQEKEAAEEALMRLMEEWEAAQDGAV